jgi:apolipoprotein N-acyltransferase
LYGLGYFAALVWWIVPTIVRYGGIGYPLGVATLFALASYLALFPCLVGFLVALAGRRGGACALGLAPLAWTGSEWLRGWLLSGFPWGDLPQALWEVPAALALAPWVGSEGVRLLVAGIGSGSSWVLLRTIHDRHASRYGLIPCGAALAVWGLLLSLPPPVAPPASEVSVAVIQGNIDQAQKWDPAYRKTTLDIYSRLSRQVAEAGARFVIWPETAVPLYAQDPSVEREALVSLAREAGVHLLFGAPAYERRGAEFDYRNAVFWMTPEGRLQGRYDKVHLVPFGEYVPLGRYLPFLKKLAEGAGDFTAGPAVRPLGPDADLPAIGPLVCFESIFPSLAARHARGGAQLLVVVTNDAWFGRTPGPYQHLAFSAWRAAEAGLPLVRAANTGVSALFDAAGRVQRRTRLASRDAFVSTVAIPKPHVTPQQRVSPWIGPVCLALALLPAFAMLLLRFRFQGPQLRS